MFQVIAFDTDDTLWHNETLFSMTQGKFRDMLLSYHDAQWINKKLYEAEMRNLQYFGYGIKGFTLSMIETAIELTEGRITGTEIQEIIEFSKEMLEAPVQPLDHVSNTLKALSDQFTLMIIGQGDLFDQETKIARSGLDRYFAHIEIVSEKTEAAYRTILEKYNIDPNAFMMVGDSIQTDVQPVTAIGGHGVYIPYHQVRVPDGGGQGDERKYNMEHIGHLPAMIERLNKLN